MRVKPTSKLELLSLLSFRVSEADQAKGDKHMQRINEVRAVTSGAAIKLDERNQSEMIVAKVPQGYETNINVRLVPGRDLDVTTILKRCRPRRGAPRRDAEPLDLPPDLIDKLKNADKVVIAWLAQDEANSRLFMAQPAEALLKAGVNLTRADQKAIERTHREVREAMVVGPGVKVTEFTVAAYPRGRIGQIKTGTKPQDKPDGNIGCAKED
jgi:hypothetical protein